MASANSWRDIGPPEPDGEGTRQRALVRFVLRATERPSCTMLVPLRGAVAVTCPTVAATVARPDLPVRPAWQRGPLALKRPPPWRTTARPDNATASAHA